MGGAARTACRVGLHASTWRAHSYLTAGAFLYNPPPTHPLCARVQGWKRNSRGKQVPFGTRLYSIASSRYGDSFDGKTCTLCVVRVVWRGVRQRAREESCATWHSRKPRQPLSH